MNESSLLLILRATQNHYSKLVKDTPTLHFFSGFTSVVSPRNSIYLCKHPFQMAWPGRILCFIICHCWIFDQAEPQEKQRRNIQLIQGRLKCWVSSTFFKGSVSARNNEIITCVTYTWQIPSIRLTSGKGHIFDNERKGLETAQALSFFSHRPTKTHRFIIFFGLCDLGFCPKDLSTAVFQFKRRKPLKATQSYSPIRKTMQNQSYEVPGSFALHALDLYSRFFQPSHLNIEDLTILCKEI